MRIVSLAMIAALLLSGCGVKGPLEAPPSKETSEKRKILPF